jgi:hypothetical protein
MILGRKGRRSAVTVMRARWRTTALLALAVFLYLISADILHHHDDHDTHHGHDDCDVCVVLSCVRGIDAVPDVILPVYPDYCTSGFSPIMEAVGTAPIRPYNTLPNAPPPFFAV